MKPRRAFLAALGMVPKLVFSKGDSTILDYHNGFFHPPGAYRKFRLGDCMVDGVQVKQVWFADVGAGIVKSYDVLGDGKPHLQYTLGQTPIGAEVVHDGLLSKTLHGRVQLLWSPTA